MLFWGVHGRGYKIIIKILEIFLIKFLMEFIYMQKESDEYQYNLHVYIDHKYVFNIIHTCTLYTYM